MSYERTLALSFFKLKIKLHFSSTVSFSFFTTWQTLHTQNNYN